jgi:hypothetical protein
MEQKKEQREREQNGRYGIIRSINQLKEQTSKYSVACCCCFFVCCVLVRVSCLWKQLKSNKNTRKRESNDIHTQGRLNSCC